MGRNFISVALALVLFCASLSFSAKTDFNLLLTDSNGAPLGGAAVLVYYQKNYSVSNLDGFVQGVTDERGAWRGTIQYSRGNESSQFAQIGVVLPTWSSGLRPFELPKSDDELAEFSLSAPSAAGAASFRLLSDDGAPIEGAQVVVMRPYFTSAKTNPGGEASFSTLSEAPSEGMVYFNGSWQQFSFIASQEGQAASAELRLPFKSPTNGTGALYSLDTFAVDPEGRPISNVQFDVSPPSPPITIRSDARGALHMSGIPFQKINLSWLVPGYKYSVETDLANLPNQIVQPVLLRMNPPKISSLGEGCYRVQVEINDPRQNSLPSVSAMSPNSSVIGFVVDKSAQVAANSVVFNRVICVQEDTSFLVLASNRFDNISATIHLKKFASSSPHMSANYSDIFPPNEPKPSEDMRLEVVVMLLVLLSALLLFYGVLRFKDQSAYAFGSITRFLHSMYKTFRSGKGGKVMFSKLSSENQGQKGSEGQPPASPPAGGAAPPSV